MSFLMPKMPAPPALVMPEVKDVPNYDDEARKQAQRDKLEATDRKRKGRKSTILTEPEEIAIDPELNKPILLGE